MLCLLVFFEVFLLCFGEERVLQDDKLTYMHYPHFHFAGRFRADTATLNNFPNFFDIRNFTQDDTLRSPDNWNPLGSGEWTVEAEVTHVCYCDYRCVGNQEEDSLCGTRITGGGTRVPAKLVDLDTQANKFAEVWGWRILVGEYFSADYVPAPFQYRWVKSTNGSDGDTEQGAAGQSILTNINWNETAEIANSQILQKIRNATRLSIRFNMDAFNEVPYNPYFGWGRITGTIGLASTETTPFAPGQRLLKAQFDGLQDAPFILNKEAKRLTIDFGNSLPITKNGSHNVTFIDQLIVAITKNKTDDKPVSCHDNLTTLGIVLYRLQNWYQTSSGVQSFPPIGVLSQDEIDRLEETPLIIAEVEGTWPVVQCKRILFSEAKNGIQLHSYTNWVLRAEPGDEVEISLLATRFGTPVPGVEIHITPFVCDKIFYEYGGPAIGTEPLPFPAKNLTTNESGLVSIQFRAPDPKKQRKFIDGQLYPYLFWDQENPIDAIKTCEEKTYLNLLKSYIVIKVFDSFSYEDPPTWRKDVYPIFKQYSLLYPVMTLNYVDLGNYYEVTQHLGLINMTLRLPRTHPNHMPVTRDLSKDKLNMILKWLDCPEEGKEEEGFTIEELRRSLQTAMEVEHSTIPTYLTALATIKKNYNNEVQAIFKQIILQEMLHLALTANLLNAVGGEPVLFSENFIPLYPTRLPGGLLPTLQVPIEKCSISLIADIFMAIEQPSITAEFNGNQGSEPNSDEYIIQGGDQSHQGIKVTGKYTSDKDTALERTGKKCGKRQPKKLVDEGPTYPDETVFHKHYNTIGEFYEYILDAFAFLTQNGTNQTIFSGNDSRQLWFNFSFGRYGKLIKITDFKSAKEAIQEIIREGEGSSPCNPLDWSNETGDLSHYFLFKSIVEQHKINVHIEDDGDRNGAKPSSKVCQGEYYFNGSKIFFDPAGVWPMVNNPRYIKYTPGSRPDVLNKEFNRIYTNLLRSLEVVFNGHPEKFVDALGLMMTVDRYLSRLVQTPLEEQGDPTVGPNAGPTFEFMPD